MYLHPVLIHDLAAARRADDMRRAARRQYAGGANRRVAARRQGRDRASPVLRLRLLRLP
jgi:hypothetical protein